MATGWLPRQNVVVPIDFTDESFDLVRFARAQFVEDPQALHIVHVLPDLEAQEPAVLWAGLDDKTRAEHAEKTIRDKLGDGEFEGAKIHVGFGDAGRQVANYASKVSADLIVIHPHHQSTIERLFLGSVADRILRLAHCPVLVLRE